MAEEQSNTGQAEAGLIDDRINGVIARILAVRNTEAIRNLCLDLYWFREEYSTEVAVAWGEDLLKKVRDYEHLDTIHKRGLCAKE